MSSRIVVVSVDFVLLVDDAADDQADVPNPLRIQKQAEAHVKATYLTEEGKNSASSIKAFGFYQ